MRIKGDNIVLRDYRLSDIEDDIRWMNVDTAWIYADTPWMKMEVVDPDELRRDMTEFISSLSEDAIRWRLEIEVEGRHIGFVSSYYLDENYEQPPWESVDQSKNAEGNHAVRALGIEICEMDAWGKGIGGKALSAFMAYYRGLGERRFLLETWSGNLRMLGCAKKLGFTEVQRTPGAHTVNGKDYDALVLERKFE